MKHLLGNVELYLPDIAFEALKPLLEIHHSYLLSEVKFFLEQRGLSPDMPIRWIVGPWAIHPEYQALVPNKSPARGPELAWDSASRILHSDGSSLAEIWQTVDLVRTLAIQREKSCIGPNYCETSEIAFERIRSEVEASFPAFQRRALDWTKACQETKSALRTAEDPIGVMQRWLASLEDPHTWLRPLPPLRESPYRALLNGNEATFLHVPDDSEGFKAGLRPGFVVDNVTSDWMNHTAARLPGRGLLAARRLLSAPPGSSRQWSALDPSSGKGVQWTETYPATPSVPVTWRPLDSDSGYLRIASWNHAEPLEPFFERALGELGKYSSLVIDLRGNLGGDLATARRFRQQLDPRPWISGQYRHSLGLNRISDGFPIKHSAAPGAPLRAHRIALLVDSETCSASEDLLLALRGRPNTWIIGERTGGGTAFPRVIPIFPGWFLTVATALVEDAQGNLLDGHGIDPDIRLQDANARSLESASLEVAREVLSGKLLIPSPR